MTKDEVLKLALEALETCGEDEWVSDDDDGMMQVYDDRKVNEAITAVKETLEQQEQDSVAMADYVALLETNAALKAKLLEPRNFCSRCGKRTADLTVIHTCTPP